MKQNQLSCPISGPAQPELLLDYVAGRLDARRAAALEDHAADCEPCQQFIADQAVLWRELDAFTPAEISPGFDQAVFAQVAAHDRAPWWVRGWRHVFAAGEPGAWRPAMALSAACAVVLTVALVRMPGALPSGRATVAHPAAVDQAVSASPVEVRDIELAERALEDMEMLQVVSGDKL
ncbi:MAG: zf-HC2 domain-containing protein [Acidobacteria bacterium]|nr:zf-HC2 domain-containing protein [Acidobacteriota bacterium]